MPTTTETQFTTTSTARLVELIAGYSRLLAGRPSDRERFAYRRWLAELRRELARRESALAPAS